MAYHVNIAFSAKNDLLDILDYIAAEKPVRALSFVDELQRRTTLALELFPESGRVYEEATRFLVIANHAVLYEISESLKTVTVLHVFPAGRNWREAD